MNRKSLIALVVYPCLLIFSACWCDDIEFDYYDFSDLQFYYTEGTEIASDKHLLFSINDKEFEYLATNTQMNFGLISTTLATQPCPTNGHLGRKFLVTDIDIVSNADFDATHPAGTSLKDILEFGTFNLDTEGNYDFSPMSSITEEATYNTLNYFRIAQRPDSPTHQFSITVTKSNGTQTTGTTADITWL